MMMCPIQNYSEFNFSNGLLFRAYGDSECRLSNKTNRSTTRYVIIINAFLLRLFATPNDKQYETKTITKML